MAQFDVYKFDMQFQLGLVLASTSFYYRQAEDDSSNGRLIAAALKGELETALWTDYLKTLLAADTSLNSVTCQLYAPTKDAPSVTPAIASFGLKVGDRLAAANAVIVTKYPTTWERAFMGRNYIPGAEESLFTGDRMETLFHTEWQDLADIQELLTIDIVSPEALSFDQVGFSATKWKNWDPLTMTTPDLYSVLNSVVVQPVMGTQRPRIPARTVGPAP